MLNNVLNKGTHKIMLVFFLLALFSFEAAAVSCSISTAYTEYKQKNCGFDPTCTSCITNWFLPGCGKRASRGCESHPDLSGAYFIREPTGNTCYITDTWSCGDSYGSCYCSGSLAYRPKYTGVCGGSVGSCSTSTSTVRWPSCDLMCCECSSGACCDGCHYYSSGTQPSGYSDYDYCSGNGVYHRNYYCTGSSATQTYSDSLSQDCCSLEVAATDSDGNDPSVMGTCTGGRSSSCSSGSCSTAVQTSYTDQCVGSCASGTCLYREYFAHDSADACSGLDACTYQDYDPDNNYNSCTVCGGTWMFDIDRCCGDDGGYDNDQDCFKTIGLRFFDGDSTIEVAVERQLISPLRIAEDGQIYSIALVDETNSKASGLKIRTASGTKHIRSY